MADPTPGKQISDLQNITPAGQLSPMAGRSLSFNKDDWEVQKGMAQVFVQSGAFPATDNMAKIMVKIQAGKELGIPPVQAVQSMYFVQGKLGMYGQALLSIMKRNGLIVKWLELTTKKAKAEFSSKDQPPVVIEFGEEDAKRAGLFSNNYLKYPQDMYVARVTSRAAKLFPELVGSSIETVEVLEDVHGAMPVDSPAAIDAAPAEEAVPAKLQTPKERKAEKKEPEVVAENDIDKAMLAEPRIAALIEKMKAAQSAGDAENIRKEIVEQSWSTPQAQWLGEHFAAMKEYLASKDSAVVPTQAADDVDLVEATQDVFPTVDPVPTDKPTYEARCEQLNKMKSVDLKPILERYGIDFKGMDKLARMEAIIKREYPEHFSEEAPVAREVGEGEAVDLTPPSDPAPVGQPTPNANNEFMTKFFGAK